MRTKADVQEAALAYMRARGWKYLSDLSHAASIPYATLGRMMAHDPSYQGRPGAWIKLANCIGADPPAVLAAVGLGPDPGAPSVPADREERLRAALRDYGVPAADVHSLILMAEGRRAVAELRQATPA